MIDTNNESNLAIRAEGLTRRYGDEVLAVDGIDRTLDTRIKSPVLKTVPLLYLDQFSYYFLGIALNSNVLGPCLLYNNLAIPI